MLLAMLLLSSVTMADVVLGATAPSYLVKDFTDVCQPDGGKREIGIGTGAAILTLLIDDAAHQLPKDLNCHLELETYDGYGLHVYMDELHLDGDERADDCRDYVQFGRDLLTFTVFKSPKYCGARPKLNFSTTADVYRNYDAGKTRIYVEAKDREMDVWLRAGKSRRGSAPRNVTLVATAFKKRCSGTDPKYKACRDPAYSSGSASVYCVRREFFCDGRPNCAFPSGDVASDERRCGQNDDDGFFSSTSTSAFNVSNVPIMMIAIIVIFGTVMALFVAIRHFVQSLKSSSSPAASRWRPG